MKAYWARFFEEADGSYSVDVPDMPGCLTYGDSFEDAYRYLVDEAMPLWLEGRDNPPASGPGAVLAAPAYDGAPRPLLVRVAGGEAPEALAQALAQAAQSDLLSKAAREYLARHQNHD
ncbi:MAG: type II toxin-antitoxin system HicB family antitoxin [Candidatus Adiutrix sp.]|nr:type II toxin-antitoxin system HicB family antitoxin [Candidatus Adiutrix sp.]